MKPPNWATAFIAALLAIVVVCSVVLSRETTAHVQEGKDGFVFDLKSEK